MSENYILYWRNKQNVSLEKLSARIEASGNNYASPKTINRWEKGTTKLPEWALTEIAKALKISELEIKYGPKEDNADSPIQISHAFTGMDIEIAENLVEMGYMSWLASSPQKALNAIENVLPWLEAAIRRAPISTKAKQGKHTLARGYELLGILALDRMENKVAINNFRRALTISEEIKDNNLIVAHMTELGESYRREKNTDTALLLMENALQKAKNTERSTQGYVSEMIAYTYSELGREQDFIIHIENATELLGHSGEGKGAIKKEFIPFEVLEIYGKGMRDFGHPTEAIKYLEMAEEALKSRPHMPRWQAVVTISKAQAMCDAGELEQGIKLAIQGIVLAHSCESPRQMNRVRKLAKSLDNKSDLQNAPILQPLQEVVSDIYLGNRNHVQWMPTHAM